jgi:alanine racemase
MSYNRAEYDTESLRNNIRLVRRLVGKERRICAAVKANGYGMGVLPMVRILMEENVDYLAVAIVEEGAELRKNGVDLPILVLGAIPEKDMPKAIYYDLTVGIFHFSTACLVDFLAGKMEKKAKVHVKIDTGMHRLGFPTTESSKGEIKVISEMPNIDLEGIFSHLSQTDKSKEFTNQQIECFRRFTDDLQAGGVSFVIRHLANSNGILDYPESYFDMVRPGILMHGFGTGSSASEELQEVLTLKSAIVRLDPVEAGAEVSYMGNYVAKTPRRIATVPLGYADGYMRCLSGKGEMLVHGRRVPQIGNICMDQCMIDVTDVPNVKVGDEVVLYGKQGDAYISVTEIAKKAQTIPHEILTTVKRVPKYYYFEDED